MRKKVFLIITILVIIVILICLSKYIKIINITSNCAYIGKEYCYTYDNNNSHDNKRYYCFYYDKDDDKFICVKNNRKIIEINSVQDLEYLYMFEVNCMIMDRTNASVTYDENDNEISSAILKNKMFPDVKSNYWDFKEQ